MSWRILMKLPESLAKRAALGAVVISTVFSAIYIYADWWAFRPHGNDCLLRNFGAIPIGILGIMALYILLCVIVGVAGRLVRLGKSTWPELVAQAISCVITLVLCIAAILMGDSFEQTAYRAMVNNGVPIVDAIQRYQAKNNTPPPSLDALVPDYLVAIPATGFDAFPSYHYLTNDPELQYGSDPWALRVDVSTDNLTRDELLYCPGQKYPDYCRRATLRTKSGNWVLLSTAKERSGSN